MITLDEVLFQSTERHLAPTLTLTGRELSAFTEALLGTCISYRQTNPDTLPTHPMNTYQYTLAVGKFKLYAFSYEYRVEAEKILDNIKKYLDIHTYQRCNLHLKDAPSLEIVDLGPTPTPQCA